jgi:hypothetical protein
VQSERGVGGDLEPCLNVIIVDLVRERVAMPDW